MPIRVVECYCTTTGGDRIYYSSRLINTIDDFILIGQENVCYLLMQQTLPRMQEPLGRPPNKEQTDPGTQIPSSPVGDLQASNVLIGFPKFGFTVIDGILVARLANGLQVFAGVNRLLKRPVLIKLTPKPPRRKRFSASWFFSSTTLPV